ncbi:MAG: alpha/beta hydrolase [Pleomorphochaeta sp.]
MIVAILIIIFIIILWSSTLVFFKDRNINNIDIDETKVFSSKCRSIILKHEIKKDTAVLMIHGFLSTPNVYQYSAHSFFEHGYDSYAYLLPGFGTSIEHFKKTNFSQWFNYISTRYEELKQDYSNVIIVGISMGGALTLKLGEKYSNTDLEPLAIVPISAPVIYNSLLKDRRITKFSFYFARIVSLFKSSFNASICDRTEIEEEDDNNNNWIGYNGLFLKQSMSLIKAEKKIRKDLKKITCPMFVIHNVSDKTVPFFNFPIIAKENNSRFFESKIIKMIGYKHTMHVLLLYYSVREELTNDIINYIEGLFDE